MMHLYIATLFVSKFTYIREIHLTTDNFAKIMLLILCTNSYEILTSIIIVPCCACGGNAVTILK